jgi:hypothetical protein
MQDVWLHGQVVCCQLVVQEVLEVQIFLEFLSFWTQIEKSDIVPSYIIQKRKILEAFWSPLSLKNIQTLPVLRQKQIMRLLMRKSWLDTRRIAPWQLWTRLDSTRDELLLGDYQPVWSGGDSGTRMSGLVETWEQVGSSGRLWTNRCSSFKTLCWPFVVVVEISNTEWTSCYLTERLKKRSGLMTEWRSI